MRLQEADHLRVGRLQNDHVVVVRAGRPLAREQPLSGTDCWGAQRATRRSASTSPSHIS
jgi:hypothetical protein